MPKVGFTIARTDIMPATVANAHDVTATIAPCHCVSAGGADARRNAELVLLASLWVWKGIDNLMWNFCRRHASPTAQPVRPIRARGTPALLLLTGLVWQAVHLPSAAGDEPYAALRETMVRTALVGEGLTNERVLDAMQAVPRHEFVPAAQRPRAYFDEALPIGFQQTISPPFIVGYMTEMIDPQPEDRVLEIGTGSGYQAAVLAQLAKEVYTIEIVEPLGNRAQVTLSHLNYNNVRVRIGDGYQGWAEHAPFDKIIVTCSPEAVPQPLIDQLKEGGRMIIPVGLRYQQVFHLLTKKNGALVEERLIPTLFVPMTGVSEKNRQILPDPLNPQLVNGSFELDENADGLADGWHYQRRCEIVAYDAPAVVEPASANPATHYLQIANQESGRPAHVLQGFPVDGRRIDAVRIDLTARATQLTPGSQSYEVPGVLVHFYDSVRRPLPAAEHKPFTVSADWTPLELVFAVPAEAREAIVQIGLNGGTGELAIDNLALKKRLRTTANP